VNYDHECMFMYNTRYSCQILKKLAFLSTDFRKKSNIKFNQSSF